MESRRLGCRRVAEATTCSRPPIVQGGVYDAGVCNGTSTHREVEVTDGVPKMILWTETGTHVNMVNGFSLMYHCY
jgi:hypothetical protein